MINGYTITINYIYIYLNYKLNDYEKQNFYIPNWNINFFYFL
jgi:hypothetical protein